MISRPSSVVPTQSSSPVIGTNPKTSQAIAQYNQLLKAATAKKALS